MVSPPPVARANFHASSRFMSWLLDDAIVREAGTCGALGHNAMAPRSATDLGCRDIDHFLPAPGMPMPSIIM